MLPRIARAWKSWIKTLINQKRVRLVRRAGSRLGVEQLESRLAPANITWTGGAGTLNWTDTKNWSTQTVPGLTDDATISTAVFEFTA